MTTLDLSAVVRELAPQGVLRAALNLGNSVLVQRAADGGEPRGVTPELAHELARRLQVQLTLVTYDGAGKVVDAAARNEWDVAFLAIDPKRGEEILFTPAYVHIEGAYVVPAGSPIRTLAEVDQPGRRIGVGRNSAYDLFLTRTLKHAELVRVDEAKEAYAMVERGELHAAGGVRQMMQRTLGDKPGLKILPENFMVIEQAMCTPRGRTAAHGYLTTFIEEMKASGFVADAVARSGQTSASVAPPADGPTATTPRKP